MYTKDKLNRITLRLNEEQFAFVKANADHVGVSPSEFLRMVINSAMSNSREFVKNSGGQGRENDKADSDDIV